MSLFPPLKPLRTACAAAIAAAGLAGAMLVGGPAAAQSSVDAPPTFPDSLDREVLLAWMKRETDVTPDSVVAVTPSALTALMSTRVMVSPRGYSVALRAESLSPEVFAREGSLSWNTAIDVDCAKRRIRQGPTTGYAARNLLYAGKVVRPADPDWIAPPAGSTLENVWRAVCDKTFERPLATSMTAAARPPVVAAEVAPPITAPPRAPAKAATTPAYPPIGSSSKPATKIYPPAPVATPPAALPRPAAPPPPAPTPPPPPPAPPPAMTPEAEAAPPASTSPAAAQLSASGSEAEAQRSLAAASARYAEQLVGRTTRVARAVVKGRVYYRALVEGFTSAADAQGFCRSLNVTGQACFVRPNGLRD